ncbi:chromate efflux transporter [Pseudorhodoplanes sinuspersici]|uniref:Chromate transporter n=1 Tax=Pseudorhodoplanes sinuspersici TaxID=1235591 RepID=A0A1W6ZLU7_9HYPH|nr:chromate efflux transporter [Pseudorhodoplanes sinuspersici]ARP98356.1 chromate transporter [Pseudorhodoplanes sinuspersici]RKE66019.1 chromate transporter [Pseudorhodoplanes sinuspersici]
MAGDHDLTVRKHRSLSEVFTVFLRLGLTSFGGPIAHLGYFRNEFVARRKWLDDKDYADLVALCQFLPGPASSQVGIAVGLLRAGFAGGFAAWLGFTLPSAIAMVLFAYSVASIGDALGSGWLHGLKIAAVAVVAQAVLGMMRSLAPDRERATLAVAAAALTLAIPMAWGQVGAIVLGGLVGLALFRDGGPEGQVALPSPVSRTVAVAALAIFFSLLVGLPLAAAAFPSQSLALFDSFYRAGSLVFGGGHVVLPLLQAEVVPPGWVSNDVFLAGYGAAQAVPGPLFTFAAFLGAAMGPQPNGWAGAALCLVAVFLPSFLLIVGALPFWNILRTRPAAQAALKGVNAAVVGLLLAALYHPVWTSGILSRWDFAVGAAAFLLLTMWKTPPWLVVVLCAIAGAILGMT